MPGGCAKVLPKAGARGIALRLRNVGSPVRRLLRAVLLFGSWAKGLADVHNDVDLVVVLRHRPIPVLRAALADAVHVVPVHVDVLVWSAADLAAAEADPYEFPGSGTSHSVILFGAFPAVLGRV